MNQTHPTDEQLIDYAHGELASHDDAAVHAHVTACPACSVRLAAEVRLSELLRAHARAQDRELPPGLATSIRARIASDPAPSPWRRFFASFRPVVAVPVAAAAALAIYFAAATWHPNAAGGSLDATYYLDNHAALATTTPFEESSSVPAVLTSDETDR